MARRTAAEKAGTHAAIVRHAARLFREHGSGVGVADVMEDAGLTHGGFYRHFQSKEDLLVAAASAAVTELSERLVVAATTAEKGRELEAIINTYLSAEHLAHPEWGCPYAALAPDLARLPARARKKLDVAMNDYVARLLPFMPGATTQERQRCFLVLISGMAGAIATIRVFGERAEREAMLAAVRDYYLQTFANTSASRSAP